MDLQVKLSIEGGRYIRPPSSDYVRSALIPGRFVCRMCGLNIPPEHMREKGVCVMCADKIDMAKHLLPMMNGDVPVPINTGFNQILVELKKSTSPASVGMAEKLLEMAGGSEGLAKAMWEDMKAVKGENLAPELKAFHTTDHRTVHGYHKLFANMMAKRDEMIQATTDPLQEMSEEDLMTVTAEAARVRIEVDSEFREEMAKLIFSIDPDLIESLHLSKYGIPSIRKTPSVRVKDP